MLLADAILKVRQFLGDTDKSHRVYPDALTQYVDTVRTVFPLSNQNIIPSTCQVIVDGGALTPLVPTDSINGLLTVTPAPQATLEAFYFYQKFTDDEITEMMDSGLSEVGLTESNLTSLNVGDPLITIMAHFAASIGNAILMERFAAQYNVTVEGVTFDKSEVYKAYKAAKDSHYKDGTEKRLKLYTRQDRDKVASTARTSAAYPPDGQMPRR